MSRVLLVDDHQLILDGINGFIKSHGKFQVVGQANSGEEALRLIDVLHPDLVITDIEMPGISGIQVCNEIKRNHPDIKVMVISMHQESQLIKKLIDQGADGYLIKTSDQSEVIHAIETVMQGGKYFSEEVNLSLTQPRQSSSSTSTIALLTDREIEILTLVAEGKTNKEIGDELNISHRTVDTHRTNLMKKLDVSNVAGLIRFAFKEGYIK